MEIPFDSTLGESVDGWLVERECCRNQEGSSLLTRT